MKRFVNGDEMELSTAAVEVSRVDDRLIVRSPDGAFSGFAVRIEGEVLVSYRGQQYRVQERIAQVRSSSQTHSGELRAPMPGQIVDIRCSVGDEVRKGETVLVLEAMKTQQPFSAPFDGKVLQVCVEKGDQVADGEIVAIIEPLVKIDG